MGNYLINANEAIDVVRRVLNRATARGQAIPGFVVLVGGTSMAVNAVRDQSEDVDFYSPVALDDAAMDVERELRPIYGKAFKIDITVGENIWGDILIKDIAQSPETQTMDIAGTTVSIRALPPADLFLLKLASGRTKDEADLDMLVKHLDAKCLISRFNQMIKWHGNRSAVLGYTDSFVIRLVQSYSVDARNLIAQLEVADYIKDELLETHSPHPEAEEDDGFTL
jgi:hypothetical protein